MAVPRPRRVRMCETERRHRRRTGGRLARRHCPRCAPCRPVLFARACARGCAAACALASHRGGNVGGTHTHTRLRSLPPARAAGAAYTGTHRARRARYAWGTMGSCWPCDAWVPTDRSRNAGHNALASGERGDVLAGTVDTVAGVPLDEVPRTLGDPCPGRAAVCGSPRLMLCLLPDLAAHGTGGTGGTGCHPSRGLSQCGYEPGETHDVLRAARS